MYLLLVISFAALRFPALRTSSSNLLSGQVEEKLSEKERDLEVAARVGLALLERNDILEQDLTRVTEQLANSERLLAQARHELGKKTTILQQYYQLQEEVWCVYVRECWSVPLY